MRYGIGSVTASIYDAMVKAIAQPAMPLIGVLSSTSPAARAGAVAAFHRGLGAKTAMSKTAMSPLPSAGRRISTTGCRAFLSAPLLSWGHVEKPIDKLLPWAQPIRAVMQFVT